MYLKTNWFFTVPLTSGKGTLKKVSRDSKHGHIDLELETFR